MCSLRCLVLEVFGQVDVVAVDLGDAVVLANPALAHQDHLAFDAIGPDEPIGDAERLAGGGSPNEHAGHPGAILGVLAPQDVVAGR